MCLATEYKSRNRIRETKCNGRIVDSVAIGNEELGFGEVLLWPFAG
jgi:hypothetical protein